MSSPITPSCRGRNIFRNVCRGVVGASRRGEATDRLARELWQEMTYYERIKGLAIIAYHGR